MYVFISILIIIVSILLILVVLVQNSKGGGIASGFSAANQIMGVRQSTELIEKLTWILAIVLVVLSLLAGIFIPSSKEVEKSKIQDKIDVVASPDQLPQDFTKAVPQNQNQNNQSSPQQNK